MLTPRRQDEPVLVMDSSQTPQDAEDIALGGEILRDILKDSDVREETGRLARRTGE